MLGSSAATCLSIGPERHLSKSESESLGETETRESRLQLQHACIFKQQSSKTLAVKVGPTRNEQI